jgi:hypothetical protein
MFSKTSASPKKACISLRPLLSEGVVHLYFEIMHEMTGKQLKEKLLARIKTQYPELEEIIGSGCLPELVKSGGFLEDDDNVDAVLRKGDYTGEFDAHPPRQKMVKASIKKWFEEEESLVDFESLLICDLDHKDYVELAALELVPLKVLKFFAGLNKAVENKAAHKPPTPGMYYPAATGEKD